MRCQYVFLSHALARKLASDSQMLTILRPVISATFSVPPSLSIKSTYTCTHAHVQGAQITRTHAHIPNVIKYISYMFTASQTQYQHKTRKWNTVQRVDWKFEVLDFFLEFLYHIDVRQSKNLLLKLFAQERLYLPMFRTNVHYKSATQNGG